MALPLAVAIKETPIHHAAGELRWLDGTSAADLSVAAMHRVDRTVQVDFAARPRDLQWLQKPGRTALWRRPASDIVNGESSDAQRMRPAAPLFRIAGEVRDPSGGYNPRTFDLHLGNGGVSGLVMYPSPLGTRFGSGGGLVGAVRFDGGVVPALEGRPAAWALVEVAVTVSDTDLRLFRAQCDGKGEFRLSLWRLPPLPEGTASYVAALRVWASTTSDRDTPIDPDTLVAALMEPVGGGDFVSSFDLDVVPGQRQRVQSDPRTLLTIRPDPNPSPGPGG